MRLLFALLCILLISCNPYAQVKEDTLKFPPISKSRPLGTVCSANDSASIQRAAVHPLVPTGGWNPLIEVDPNRKPHSDARGITRFHSNLIGFVQYITAGEVKARAYDDVYGSVYCGWAPAGARLDAQGKLTRVVLGTCGVGDGGLQTVHEVCWFSQGNPEGKVIYSSAYPAPEFNPADLYRPEDLGNNIQFQDHLAFEVLDGALKIRDDALAEAVIEQSFVVLGGMRDLRNGSTGQAIPARQYYRNTWVRLMAFRLGLHLGKPDFDTFAKALESELAPTLPYHCESCARLRARLPQYRELNTLKGEAAKAYFKANLVSQAPYEFERAAGSRLFTN